MLIAGPLCTVYGTMTKRRQLGQIKPNKTAVSVIIAHLAPKLLVLSEPVCIRSIRMINNGDDNYHQSHILIIIYDHVIIVISPYSPIDRSNYDSYCEACWDN